METERLVLRLWRESDADDLLRYAGKATFGPVGWTVPASREEALHLIRTDFIPGPETYAIEWKETGEVIGLCGLQFDDLPDVSDREEEEAVVMGCWLGEPYWGRGIMSEALGLLLERCFSELAIRSVWVAFDHDNRRAGRLFTKLGFTHRITAWFVPDSVLEKYEDDPAEESQSDGDDEQLPEGSCPHHFFGLTAEAYRDRVGQRS